MERMIEMKPPKIAASSKSCILKLGRVKERERERKALYNAQEKVMMSAVYSAFQSHTLHGHSGMILFEGN